MAHVEREETKPNEEDYLLDHLRLLAPFRAGRRAAHLHLSRLRGYDRHGPQFRIARHNFEQLAAQCSGQFYVLGNADMVLLWKGMNVGEIAAAVADLHRLFAEDPLAGEDQGQFCTWYDLEQSYDELLAVVRHLQDVERARGRRLAAIAGSAPGLAAGPLRPLDPDRLDYLVEAIRRADLSNMMRRQTVCIIDSDAAPQPVFREVYISIDELRNTVTPDYDLTGDRWLFLHLTRTLDDRMLQLLAKNDDRALARAFSININVATLLSERFLAFDAGLRATTRLSITLELQLADIMADFATFQFARDFVRQRGYRLCLDGVTDARLPPLDCDRLGFDFVKLIWQPALLDSSGEGRRAECRSLVASLDRARTILCRCDSPEGVLLGRDLGIRLFQGRHIDRLLGSGTPSLSGRLASGGAALSGR